MSSSNHAQRELHQDRARGRTPWCAHITSGRLVPDNFQVSLMPLHQQPDSLGLGSFVIHHELSKNPENCGGGTVNQPPITSILVDYFAAEVQILAI